jgi:hypothetical protein
MASLTKEEFIQKWVNSTSQEKQQLAPLGLKKGFVTAVQWFENSSKNGFYSIGFRLAANINTVPNLNIEPISVDALKECKEDNKCMNQHTVKQMLQLMHNTAA